MGGVSWAEERLSRRWWWRRIKGLPAHSGCTGELAEPNVILFPDTFDSLKAALSYTYRRGQFEHDVILYQDPGPLEDWGFNADSTMLEIYTVG